MTAIVILGAAVWQNGASPTLRRRTRHGAALYHEGHGDVVIPCGGLGRFPPTEAEVMAEILRAEGVPSDAIRLEASSTNTVQNIRNAVSLLEGETRVILVSDAYHLPRARLIARREGLEVSTSAPPLKGARLWPQVKGWLWEIPGVIAVVLRIR
ncbi:YdcF family protein [Gymnodinialimonas ceratoperidinii]|uniref:YdcF family protein n=1 Tax=Gymnodinialimonas ceratoperidinii TaxID=2856823 RepID=A0A8F6YCY8_9RHOB|nr:YdcF family protein [Gymnodinialimonas ceratoperidinii]QXT39682.1 YdcF family protein [Gymnodinialimonas ceratoperidinii]